MGHFNAPAALLSVALSLGCELQQAHDAPPQDAPQAATRPSATFTNPIYRGQDPWIVRRDGWYFLCQSAPGNGTRGEHLRPLTIERRDRPRSLRVHALLDTPPPTGALAPSQRMTGETRLAAQEEASHVLPASVAAR